MGKIGKTELTTRQWQLYNLLKSNPEHWFSQKEICEAIDGYEYRERKATNDKCVDIWHDREKLNDSTEPDHIIAMKKYHFKIANREEVLAEEQRLHKVAMTAFKRAKALRFKQERNGQHKLLTSRLEPMEESRAKAYYETFVECNQ